MRSAGTGIALAKATRQAVEEGLLSLWLRPDGGLVPSAVGLPAGGVHAERYDARSLTGNILHYCTKWYDLPMSRAFRIRTFTRWMRKAGLTDDALCVAVSEMAQGLVDADLGGHVVKKRARYPVRASVAERGPS